MATGNGNDNGSSGGSGNDNGSSGGTGSSSGSGSSSESGSGSGHDKEQRNNATELVETAPALAPAMRSQGAIHLGGPYMGQFP